MAVPARLPLVVECALDVIARHRAAGEPLERVAAATSKSRRLGPKERSALGDLVFGWARHRQGAERLIAVELKRRGGRPPALRERDLCAVLLAQVATAAAIDARARARLDDGLAALLDEAALRGLGAALPPWLETRLRGERADAELLIDALARPAPIGLALDGARVAVEQVIAAVLATGARAERSPIVRGAVRVEGRLRLARLPAAIAEAVWPMDEGSQVVVRALGATPGELVLDLCAGAGTKTRLLLASGARVVAADLAPARLGHAPRQAARVVMDGARPALREGSFDKVLVDAPCSGTGTLRRAPDVAYRLREDDLAKMVPVQRQLLMHALALARPGGLVVYATCSLLREENQAVVEHVLAAVPRARPVPLKALWGDDVSLDDGGRGQIALLPHLHGTDGFYVAALRAP